MRDCVIVVKPGLSNNIQLTLEFKCLCFYFAEHQSTIPFDFL